MPAPRPRWSPTTSRPPRPVGSVPTNAPPSPSTPVDRSVSAGGRGEHAQRGRGCLANLRRPRLAVGPTNYLTLARQADPEAAVRLHPRPRPRSPCQDAPRSRALRCRDGARSAHLRPGRPGGVGQCGPRRRHPRSPGLGARPSRERSGSPCPRPVFVQWAAITPPRAGWVHAADVSPGTCSRSPAPASPNSARPVPALAAQVDALRLGCGRGHAGGGRCLGRDGSRHTGCGSWGERLGERIAAGPGGA